MLTGDFSRAWQGVQKIAAGRDESGSSTAYNNTIGLIPGVSKIDMVAFADNMDRSAAEAEKSLSTAMGDAVTAVKTAGGDIIQSEKGTSAEVADEHEKRLKETEDFWEDTAEAAADYREKELTADALTIRRHRD